MGIIEIFHITDADNFGSILQSGGIFCKNVLLQRQEIRFTSIAYEGIQDKRSSRQVSLPPFGNLHDYVPFSFAPRSPMLGAIHVNNVPGYTKGQQRIIHLVSCVQNVIQSEIQYVFCDGHPIMRYSDFFRDLSKLKNIDWNIMQTDYWADTEEDGDRMRRRQAEFLVYRFMPVRLLTRIGVNNIEIKGELDNLLRQWNIAISVQVCQDWYYR